MKGTIVRVDQQKGFGFIRDEDGVERFFHHSSLSGKRFDDVVPGQDRVTFEPTETPKGLRAEQVRIA